jgi:hypothetical protein
VISPILSSLLLPALLHDAPAATRVDPPIVPSHLPSEINLVEAEGSVEVELGHTSGQYAHLPVDRAGHVTIPAWTDPGVYDLAFIQASGARTCHPAALSVVATDCVVEPVIFERGSTELDARARASLRRSAACLAARGSRKVTLHGLSAPGEGVAFLVGAAGPPRVQRAYSPDLAWRRARAVAATLASDQVATEIRVLSRPLVKGDPSNNLPRVELIASEASDRRCSLEGDPSTESLSRCLSAGGSRAALILVDLPDGATPAWPVSRLDRALALSEALNAAGVNAQVSARVGGGDALVGLGGAESLQIHHALPDCDRALLTSAQDTDPRDGAPWWADLVAGAEVLGATGTSWTSATRASLRLVRTPGAFVGLGAALDFEPAEDHRRLLGMASVGWALEGERGRPAALWVAAAHDLETAEIGIESLPWSFGRGGSGFGFGAVSRFSWDGERPWQLGAGLRVGLRQPLGGG